MENKKVLIVDDSKGGREEVIRALRLGANNYLVKPIDKDTLKQKITDYFKIGK
jgi:response regulator of citrate/malate metabolism